MSELQEEPMPISQKLVENISVLEIMWVMLRLGCIAFGGPVAHIAYFQKELIERRKWLDEYEFADLITFCQFLPGPASSQIGMGIGYLRAGWAGMLGAWFAFTLPSAVLLILAAMGLLFWPALHAILPGLLIAVIVIVADAVLKLGKKLCPDRSRISLAVAMALIVLFWPGISAQFLVIGIGALFGLTFCRREANKACDDITSQKVENDVQVERELRSFKNRQVLGLMLGLLLCVTAFAPLFSFPQHSLFNLSAIMIKTGALVFGGGHVVLPMLQEDIVTGQWLTIESFLGGYGLTQSVPGPIFTFSAFIGAASAGIFGLETATMVLWGAVACVAIFSPSFVMLSLLLPWWSKIRTQTAIRAALLGINAAVLGLLLSALVNPVIFKAFTFAIENGAFGPERNIIVAVSLTLVTWVLLAIWKVSPVIIMLLCALFSYFVMI